MVGCIAQDRMKSGALDRGNADLRKKLLYSENSKILLRRQVSSKERAGQKLGHYQAEC